VPRLLACLFLAAFALPLRAAEPLRTVAEKTGYATTSRYADVVAFCDDLAKRSPAVKVSAFGTSHEGRKLPLLVIADPPVNSAEEATKAGKLAVLAFANIHASEVDGKEAILALARDLTEKKSHPLLKDLVILLVPILNADGNEKLDPKNRPEQNGPAAVGTRENAQGLDLNRDFVKLETPEVRALVKLLNTWDPAVVIDCHTTNGSKHRYTLTYDGPRYPSTDRPLSVWANGTMLPEVGKRVKAATGFDTAPYGNFSADRTKWETYPATPRYGVQYVALRGRIGILSESYSYAPFRDRVKATYAFVKACFEVAAEKKAELRKAMTAPAARIPLRTQTVPFAAKQSILGFEEEVRGGKRVATDKPKEYRLDFVGKVEPALVTEVPFAHLVPGGNIAAIDALRRHGVKVEELREDIDLPVEAFEVTAVDTQAQPVQKQHLVTVVVKKRGETRRVPAGTVLVRTSQPLGTLAAYLLEPWAEDGLTTWGVFSDLLPGKDFPVLRLPKAVPLTTGQPRPLPEDRVTNKPITEELLFGGRGRGFTFGFAGNPAGGLQWLDAEHFLQPKEGKLWKVEARTGKAELFADPEKLKKSLAAVPEIKDAERISKAIPTRMNPDRTAMLVDAGQDLAVAYFDGRPAVRLTKSAGPKEFVTFSPDGKRVAFVRGGNLFAVEIAKPEEKKLTTDGGGDILNARGDWVYEEEIFMRDGRAYWWSPDGTQLAFLRFDDAPVRKFNIVDLQPNQGKLETYPYPKAGAPNPLVRIGVVPATGGLPVTLDLGEYPAADTLIARVGWRPDSKGVYAYVQNRTQTWLDFLVWDTPAAKPRKLFRETTKAWVDDPGEPRFLPDGSFLFPSERTGWKHLYHYAAGGKLIRPVTEGAWEVREVVRVDGKDGAIYFTGTKDGSTRLHLYRTKLDGGEVERVTPSGGSHQVSLATSGPLYIDRYTDSMTPTQVYLCEAGASRVRTLDTNPVYDRDEYRFGKFEAVSVPMPDGFTLNGTLVYPPDFDPAKKYPVWVFTYAGPHTPTVREGWGGGRVMDQALAASGVVVFRVDPRSASGRGALSAWAAYKQLGVQELKDLEAAVAWLGKKGWADLNRVGISGHSYGGFMAAYALTHSKMFAAGIASGPVTDWRLYDSIYTERYMLTPKENAEGYERSSVVKAAKNLHGRLLIVHGMMDDNVHVQNSVQLADALQAAGKEFEMMFYPRSRHGIGSPHYLRLQLDFIRRTMGVKKG
jgi:dipeptidyl aminopeptidase/acylaminoacyl peptidase